MPILDKNTVEFFSRSPEQTRRVGIRLGGLLESGDLICLQGELGAGKTTFVQGVAQGWGSSDAVSSPTFVLVNVYHKSEATRLFHLDCYRIESLPEAEELDFETMLAQGPLVIEWPERVKPILPAENLWVDLDYIDDTQRAMRFRASGERYEALLADLRESAFGVAPATLAKKDGSLGVAPAPPTKKDGSVGVAPATLAKKDGSVGVAPAPPTKKDGSVGVAPASPMKKDGNAGVA